MKEVLIMEEIVVENKDIKLIEPEKKVDPFLKMWEDNFNENYNNKIFNKNNVKPLLYIENTKPFNNMPVVLVAAGPSLDKNIHILKQYKDNVIILCADIITFKLLENDIIPDFVCNIDSHETVQEFFHNLDTSKLNLVCPTTAYPKLMSEWKGKLTFFNQADIPNQDKDKILSKITKKTGGFGTLFNRFFVGATMLQVAKILNPSIVMLMGYDFCFSNGKPYCEGATKRKVLYENFKYNINQDIEKRTLELVNFEVGLCDKEYIIDGIKIKGKTNLDFYVKVLTALIMHYKLPIINCTEGGIYKDIDCMNLEQAILKYAPNILNKNQSIKKRKKKR
jgi:hypothetical protein